MILYEDTRQKTGLHTMKHDRWRELGIEMFRMKLDHGDYMLDPNGRISVDTKQNMSEIATNIGSDHMRFRNECIRSKDASCQLIILVENLDGIRSINDVPMWVNPRKTQWDIKRDLGMKCRPVPPISDERLMKSMQTMESRYGVRFEFCSPEESADRVLELLGA